MIVPFKGHFLGCTTACRYANCTCAKFRFTPRTLPNIEDTSELFPLQLNNLPPRGGGAFKGTLRGRGLIIHDLHTVELYLYISKNE